MDPVTIGLALASQFAPSIIKYFTDSDTAADVAGQVIDVAKAVTGKGEPESALAALQADPDLAMKFKTAIMENDTELEKSYLADRQSARNRDVAIVQAGRTNHRADILAVLAVGALCLCVWMVASHPDLPAGAREAIMFVAGVFAAAVRDVYGFEFGSSRGSKEKDSAITKLTAGR